jgi:hypothetical protein
LLPHCGVTFNLSIGQGTTLSDIVFTQQLLAEVQIETDAIIFQIVSLAREYLIENHDLYGFHVFTASVQLQVFVSFTIRQLSQVV